MPTVKICGLNSPAAFDAAVEAGADFVGFVFFPPSPRNVTAAQAAALSGRAAGGPGRVGLFVDPDDDAVAAVLDGLALDALQLHATPERAAALRRRFGLPVWRAVGVTGKASLPIGGDGQTGCCSTRRRRQVRRFPAAMRRPSTGPCYQTGCRRCPGCWPGA